MACHQVVGRTEVSMISFHQGSPVLTGCCSHLCWTTVIIFNCQGYSQKIKAVLMLFQCLLIFYLFANSILVSPFKKKKKRNDRNKRKNYWDRCLSCRLLARALIVAFCYWKLTFWLGLRLYGCRNGVIPRFLGINLRLVRYASFVASSIEKNEHCQCKENNTSGSYHNYWYQRRAEELWWWWRAGDWKIKK